MLSEFPFFQLELDFFPPEIRLTITTGSPGPGVPGSINSISGHKWTVAGCQEAAVLSCPGRSCGPL